MTVDFETSDLFVGPLPEGAYTSFSEKGSLPIEHIAVEIGARALYTYEVSKYDVMTGFLRRDAFLPTVNELNSKSDENNVLFMIDMIGLGKINDAGGQEAGDKAIKDMAIFINKLFSMEEEVIFGRLGGDEVALACRTKPGQHYEEVVDDVLGRFEAEHVNAADVPSQRIWHTSMRPGDTDKVYLPAGDPKAKDVIPFISSPSGMYRARISSKNPQAA